MEGPVEEVVLGWLATQKAETLEGIYTLLELELSENLKGKKTKLLNELITYLCSLEDVVDGDKGLSVYLKIKDFIEEEVSETREKNSPEVKYEVSEVPVSKTSASSKNETRVDYVKLKDFKISGSIGGKGDSLSFSSLLYQVDCGKRAGYSENIICDAVIRAIAPSNPLRTYLEGKHGLNISELVDILNSTFREKDSSAVLMELGNAAQQPAEPSVDFIVRLMSLRDRVLVLSREEKCPLDEKVVATKFFHSLFTGLRNTNVRAELRELCGSNRKIPDNVLLKYASEATKNEQEHNDKMHLSKKHVTISEVSKVEKSENDLPDKKKKTKENPFVHLEEVKFLQNAHEKEMAAIRAEMCEMKTLLENTVKGSSENNDDGKFYNGNGNPRNFRNLNGGYNSQFRGRGGRGGRFQNFRYRCRKCVMDNVQKCHHCWKCNGEGHLSFVCPVDQKNE